MCSYAYALMMICVVVNVNDGVNLAVAHYDNAVANLHIELTWQKIVKVRNYTFWDFINQTSKLVIDLINDYDVHIYHD